MLNQKNTVEILRKELPRLRDTYGVRKIGIFGSFAKGIEKGNSDIDIVVELEKPLGFKFIEFAEYLEGLLGRKVDILTPAGISGIRVRKVADNIARSVLYV